MKGCEKVKEYEQIEKKVDKILKEKNQEKTDERELIIKNFEKYNLEREKINKQIMKLRA
jgi:hypothetical protein